jgi:hypothetical protein
LPTLDLSAPEIIYDMQTAPEQFATIADSKGWLERNRAGVEVRESTHDREAPRGLGPGQYQVEVCWNKKTGQQVCYDDPPNLRDETVQVIPPRVQHPIPLDGGYQAGKEHVRP